MKVIDLTKNGIREWQAGDAMVWMHEKHGLYCWACSSRTCEHVQAVGSHLREEKEEIGCEEY